MCSLPWNLQLTWKHSRLSPYYCRSMPHCPLLQRPVIDHSVLWSTLQTIYARRYVRQSPLALTDLLFCMSTGTFRAIVYWSKWVMWWHPSSPNCLTDPCQKAVFQPRSKKRSSLPLWRRRAWTLLTLVYLNDHDDGFQNHCTFNASRPNCSASWMFCVAGTVIHFQTVYSTVVIA